MPLKWLDRRDAEIRCKGDVSGYVTLCSACGVCGGGGGGSSRYGEGKASSPAVVSFYAAGANARRGDPVS